MLYNGDVEWTAAREVSDLFAEAPEELARYQPRMPFLLIDEQRLRRSDLESLRNLAAALFRLEQSRKPAEMFNALDALAEWLQDRTDLLEAFLAWIAHVLLPRKAPDVETQEKNPTLEELKIMLQQRAHKTWAEMMQEDAAKAAHARMLETQLEAKFGALDDSVRSRLHEANSEQLLRWGTRLLTAKSLAEVFE